MRTEVSIGYDGGHVDTLMQSMKGQHMACRSSKFQPRSVRAKRNSHRLILTAGSKVS